MNECFSTFWQWPALLNTFRLLHFEFTFTKSNSLYVLQHTFITKEEEKEIFLIIDVSFKLNKGVLSVADVQEKTAAYVSGRITKVQFTRVLESAFGKKYQSILPVINENLPAKKKIWLKVEAVEGIGEVPLITRSSYKYLFHRSTLILASIH